MKIVIWGLGTRGMRIFSKLRPGEVVAFIDNDPTKVGVIYKDTKVINLEQYIESYSNYFIVVSLLKPDEVICQLREKGIYNYFDVSDCPAEIWGPWECTFLDMYLESLNQGQRYGILGSNFYGIYCCDRMRKNGTENIFLIQDLECDERKKIAIENSFDFVRFIPVDICKNCLDHIFVAMGSTKKVCAIKERLGLEIGMEDIFDLSRKIFKYQNPEMIRFRDIHSGERCFIVATGPSLTMKDLDTLHQNDEICISMNRIYLAFEQTRWRPCYYVVSDWRCIQEDEEIIRSLPIPYKFVADQYPDFWKKKTAKGIYRYHEHWSYVADERPPFSDDLVFGTYARATITYDCIQLAVYLGFRKIYLLGVDCNFSPNYKDKSNHFISTYYNDNSQTGLFLEKESIEAYEAAKEYTDAHGIKIYNATRGGRLEVFERVDFDTLFEKE